MGNWLEMSFENNFLLWEFFFVCFFFFLLTMTECHLGDTFNQQTYKESGQLLL